MKYSRRVSFKVMDRMKKAAQKAGKATVKYLKRFGFEEVKGTRGESAHVVRTPWGGYIGFVIEALGTKNLVTDQMREQLCIIRKFRSRRKTKQLSANVAVCAAGAVFNDLASSGIRAVIYGQHLAAGSPEWFKDRTRKEGLIAGTAQACHEVKCCWGCGETATLVGIVEPHAAELGGASWGICDFNQLITCRIQHGDRILILPSSGLHANGYSLAREIADTLPKGYLTLMDDGMTFGEGLLQRTVLYGPIMETCQKLGADIHYAVNVTGHGWRKFMRALEPFVYIIERVPKPQPVFRFIQKHGKLSTGGMYWDFNMGAGFVLIVPKSSVPLVKKAARRHGIEALDAGWVEKRGKQKRLEIRPLGIKFLGSDLKLR